MTIAPAGAMNRRLTLETPVRSGDEAASATLTWSNLGLVWAAVTPRTGREIVTADGQAARISHEISIRWRGDITAALRFRDGATIYLIHAVRDGDQHRRRLICLVEEQAP
jgi:SPP1 family predicted phage head-tail adaptor